MTQDQILIVKRNGTKEALNLDKIHNMLYKACDGLTGVSVSDIAMRAKLSFYNGMSSKEIHTALIKSAADLISEDGVNYQYVAGNLLNYELRKTAWGSMEPPRLYDHVVKMVEKEFYTPELLDLYSEADFDRMDGFIDHDRDFKMTYIGLNEYMNKYDIRDRTLEEFTPLETPQITYMLIAALSVLDTREIRDIKSMYTDFSQWNISLPTPIMAGLRGVIKQFSSCTLVDAGDSIEGITAANEAIIKYSAKRAGIGVNASAIRAEGDSVGLGGATKHTGVIPFLRSFEGALKSSAQGSIRGSSACVYLAIWHYEVMDLLVLKNNKGTPDSRVRKMDYGFQINNYLYNRLIDGKNITLFSPSKKETPGLYEAFFDKDPSKFIKLYEKYEKDPKIRKRTVNSHELFSSLITERKETGRIYVFNVDNVNQNSTYKVPISMSNLCLTGDTRISTSLGIKTLKELYDSQEKFYVASDIRAYEGSELLQNKKYSTKFDGPLGVKMEPSSKVFETSPNAKVYEIVLNNGMALSLTPDHKVMTSAGYKSVSELSIGDNVYVQSGEGGFCDSYELPTINYTEYLNNHQYDNNLPMRWNSDLAFIMGWLVGDGFIAHDHYLTCFSVGKDDVDIEDTIRRVLSEWLPQNHITESTCLGGGSKQLRVHSKQLYEFLRNLGCDAKPSHEKRVPHTILSAPKDIQQNFLSAIFGADGTVDISAKCMAMSVSYTSTSKLLIDDIQLMLSNFGIHSSQYLSSRERIALLPNSIRELREYNTKDAWVLKVGKSNRQLFENNIGFCLERKQKVLASRSRGAIRGGSYQDKFMSPVRSITFKGEEPVYDITVENSHSFIANGIVVHNCAEITLPTTPLNSFEEEIVTVKNDELVEFLQKTNEDLYTHKYEILNSVDDSVNVKITKDKGLLALCTLSAINLGNVKNLDDLESICKNSVRALDNLLDYQDYMVPAAKRHSMLYRPLGIGITNLAYYLAKNGFKYSDSGAFELIHDTMEAISFYCIKASIDLAKERGPCIGYSDTTWSDGILPIDRYNKNVDQIINPKLKLDWEWLRKQLEDHGIRNASLTAAMPAESSSRIFNSTNGVEPVRSLITVKSNKDHISKQVVPEFSRLKNKYDLLWDMKDMDGIIKMMAVIQKFTCQSISSNTSYNPEHYENGEIPMSILIGDLLKSNYFGLKTLYYNNIRDGAEDTVVEDAEELPSLQEIDENNEDDVCDSCSV